MSKRFLIVLALLLLLGASYVFHKNALESAHRADAIVRSDTTGVDNTAAIRDLKDYVELHMGSSVTFKLSASFARAQAKAQDDAKAADVNSRIYAQAQVACGGKSDSITQARCNQEYLAKHLVNVPPAVAVAQPKLADFTYHFASPVWTPDLAGALAAGAAAAIIMLLPSLLGRKRARRRG